MLGTQQASSKCSLKVPDSKCFCIWGTFFTKITHFLIINYSQKHFFSLDLCWEVWNSFSARKNILFKEIRSSSWKFRCTSEVIIWMLIQVKAGKWKVTWLVHDVPKLRTALENKVEAILCKNITRRLIFKGNTHWHHEQTPTAWIPHREHHKMKLSYSQSHI